MSCTANEDPATWQKVVVQSCKGDWFAKAKKMGVPCLHFVHTGYLNSEYAALHALTLLIEKYEPPPLPV